MYQKLNLIGRGANGDVYLGRNKEKETHHVIKTLKMRDITDKQRQTIQTQLKLLKQFKHPNIVPFHDSFIDRDGSLNIVMAYCQGGDMHNLIQNAEGKKFSQKQIIQWVVQLALSIFYMHQRRVLHRDIKTQNIFLTSGRIMLGDFGVSKVLDKAADLARTNIGTPYYMSPQQYRNRPYSYKSDIWAFGCIIYEMCNHKHVFQAFSLQSLAVKVTRGVYAPVSECYSRNLKNLVGQMLNQDPKNRPSIIQILKKPFLYKRVRQYMKQVYENQSSYEKQQIESLKDQAKTLGFSLQQSPVKAPANKKQRTPSNSNRKSQKKHERSQQKLKEQRQKKYEQLRNKLRQQVQQRKKAQQRLKSIQKNKPNRKSQKNLHSNYNYANMKSKRNSMKTEASTVSNKSSRIKKQYGNKSSTDLQIKQTKPKNKIINQKTQAQKAAKIQIKKEQKSNTPKKQLIEIEDERMDKFKMKEEYDMNYEEYEQQQKLQQVNQINQDDYDEDYQRNQKKQEIKFIEPQEQKNQQVVEQSIHQLKEQVKEKTIIISNLKNQMTKLDFVISSDSQNENENRDLNPAYTRLTQKINDLKQKVITQLGRQGYSSFLNYIIANQGNITRNKVLSLIGEQNIGIWHIAENIIKLDKVLNKVPKFTS